MLTDPSFVVPLIINAAQVNGTNTYPVNNPATNQKLWSATSATLDDVNAIAVSSAKALPVWKALKLTERRNFILKAGEVMEARAAEFKEAMQLETASDDLWCAFNINASIDMVKNVASRIWTLEGTIPETDDPAVTAMVLREPYGVVLAVAPWNAPILLGIRSIIYPLAAGNTVIFKGSELSPRTHFLIASIFKDAGFPPGVVNFLSHSRKEAPAITLALINAPSVRKINFTGSTAVGRLIAEAAGKALKPVTLELGGKAPMIVFEDADIDKATTAGAFGAFHNAGQICMSAEKILVHKSISAAFITTLKEKVASMYGDSQVMILPTSAAKVEGLIVAASESGATLHHTPMESSNPHDHQNVIITGVTSDMDIWHTETFGPVVMVVDFVTEEEAVEKANDTEYGLSAAVWTRDLGRGIRIAKQIESGAVHINGATVHDDNSMPHGGVKSSGFGRFNGTWGLDEFTTFKTITFQS